MKIEFKKATSSDLERVITCINITFCQDEPISKSLSLTHQEFESFIRIFSMRSILNGHTTLAVDEDNNLLGCLVSEDFSLSLPEDSHLLHEKMRPVFSILGDLDHHYLSNNPSLKDKKIFHILMAGVFTQYSGNRITEGLIQYQEKQVQDEGFELIIAEVTGPTSQKIFRKVGYQTGYKIFYKDYEFHGIKIYSNITDCLSCDLVFKFTK